jgi:hypothetical protein
MRHIRRFDLPAVVLFILVAAPTLKSEQVSPTVPNSTTGHRQPQGAFDLDVARLYEKQFRWKEAEQEYLQAGRIGATCIKKEALAGIERLSAHRPADEESFESELGKLYEEIGDWKDAELHYSQAAKDAPKPIRDVALKNVARVHEHLWIQERIEDFDRWVGYVARGLALLYLVVLLSRLYRMRRGIQFMAFEVSADEANKRLSFALSSAREDLPSLLSPVLTTMAANVVDSVPLIMLPGVENEFPDPAEDLEVGEIKLPLANWIRFFNHAAVRVSGRWQVGQTTGNLQARILRRSFPMTYNQSRLASARIDSGASDAQDQQLRFFGYDVLVKAIFSRRYGP